MRRLTAITILLAVLVPIICLTIGCDDWRIDAFRSSAVSSIIDGVATGIDLATDDAAHAIGETLGDVLTDFIEGLAS